MLIRMRDKKGKLRVRDVLDVDFDMSVDQCGDSAQPEYCVKINRQYVLDETFYTENDAENAMIGIARARNKLEEEIRSNL